MSLSLVRGGRQDGPVPRASVLAVLRQIRAGRKPAIGDPPELWHAVTEAIRCDWLELSNDKGACAKWRYRITDAGKREIERKPMLRLIVGGK